jgi:hypothetical protein
MEIAILRSERKQGAKKVALLLDRSVKSVQCAAERQRISLRRPGVRRGRILGQTPGLSIRSLLGDAAAESLRDDPARSELLAARMKIDRDAPLCPQCAARPQRVTRTGLCLRCHLLDLKAHYIEVEIAEEDARRELWTIKQQKHRAKEKASS